MKIKRIDFDDFDDGGNNQPIMFFNDGDVFPINNESLMTYTNYVSINDDGMLSHIIWLNDIDADNWEL